MGTDLTHTRTYLKMPGQNSMQLCLSSPLENEMSTGILRPSKRLDSKDIYWTPAYLVAP